MPENLDHYPQDVENGMYVIAFIESITFVLICVGVTLSLCGAGETSKLVRFSTIFTELVRFLGQWGTIGSVVFLLWKTFEVEIADKHLAD